MRCDQCCEDKLRNLAESGMLRREEARWVFERLEYTRKEFGYDPKTDNECPLSGSNSVRSINEMAEHAAKYNSIIRCVYQFRYKILQCLFKCDQEGAVYIRSRYYQMMLLAKQKMRGNPDGYDVLLDMENIIGAYIKAHTR